MTPQPRQRVGKLKLSLAAHTRALLQPVRLGSLGLTEQLGDLATMPHSWFQRGAQRKPRRAATLDRSDRPRLIVALEQLADPAWQRPFRHLRRQRLLQSAHGGGGAQGVLLRRNGAASLADGSMLCLALQRGADDCAQLGLRDNIAQKRRQLAVEARGRGAKREIQPPLKRANQLLVR